MNHNQAIAFSLVVLSGAIVFGCGVIADCMQGGRPGTAEWAIGVGCALGVIGLVSLWAECTNSWDRLRTHLDSLRGQRPTANRKPAVEKVND